MQEEVVKFVIFVPESHADIVREVLGKNGAGKIGDYEYCFFSVKGVSQFLPTKTAHPTIGQIGKLEKVIEEKIETVCYKKDLEKIIEAINKVHPYEEVAYDIYPLVQNPHDTTKK